MYRGYGAISYTDPTQTANAAQGFVNQLAANPANQGSVVSQLQQMDPSTRGSVCAQMGMDCMNTDDPSGCANAVASACSAAQSGVAPASTSSAISTTGAVVLGIGVVALLFWAIK